MTTILILLFCLLIALVAFLIYASAYIGSGVYVKAICRLPVKEKILALTFDDGPDERTTPLVLDMLAKHQVKAVFFCIGNRMKTNQSLVERIIREGHSIGNHTYTHNSRFPLFSVSEIKDDIRQCEEIIAIQTGQKNLSLFRPPFGVTNPRIAKAVKESNYLVLGWSLRSFDTTIKNPQRVIDRVMGRIKPGDIILFHDDRENCPIILDVFIEKAKEAGYKFVRADEKLK